MTETATHVEPAWLAPTWFLDHDHPDVAAFVDNAVAGVSGDRAKAVALFLAVRDGYRYDPYVSMPDAASYRASEVVGSEANWCVPKSVLLTASARRAGIAARLGFADVKNHLTSEKLSETMKTDVFYWHGYSELLIEGKWLKVSSAFNIEMCERFGVKVLDFDGTDHALMHPFDEAGNKHMEYLNQRGAYNDLPLDEILATFTQHYPGFMDNTVNNAPGQSGASAYGDDAFT